MAIISSALSGHADERASQEDLGNVAESFHHRGTEDTEKAGRDLSFRGRHGKSTFLPRCRTIHQEPFVVSSVPLW